MVLLSDRDITHCFMSKYCIENKEGIGRLIILVLMVGGRVKKRIIFSGYHRLAIEETYFENTEEANV